MIKRIKRLFCKHKNFIVGDSMYRIKQIDDRVYKIKTTDYICKDCGKVVNIYVTMNEAFEKKPPTRK